MQANGPKDLENDLNTSGLFFEMLAIRDLRTYADALMCEVAHYKDPDKLDTTTMRKPSFLMVLTGVRKIRFIIYSYIVKFGAKRLGW